MRYSTFSVVTCAMMGLQAVLGSPLPAESSSPFTTELGDDIFLLGPASYEELQTQVAEAKAAGKVNLDKRQACGEMGVYLCADANFGGACYWGAYPGCTRINPDPYWQSRISSVGPDSGVACYFWSFTSTVQGFTYPGGNCNADLNDKVLYFHCNPDV